MAASGKTFLQIVNAVLARLREASVSAWNETTYSTFIGGLVNTVKGEIESAYPWQALRTTITVSATADDTQYTLTGSGPEGVILDAWNTTTNRRLKAGTNLEFNEYFYGTSVVQQGEITKYMPAGVDASSSYDRVVDVWPSPTGTNTLKFEVFVPQADLAADATVALVPQSLLIEETIARALVERGDETAPKPQPGETFILKDLLATAVSRESGQDPDEMDWDAE